MYMLCVLVLDPTFARGGELFLTPEISGAITWNDNFFLKNFEDVEFRVTPRLNSGYTFENTKLQLMSELSKMSYGDNSKFDRTNYAASAALTNQFSERLKINLSGGWRQDFSLDDYWNDDGTQKSLLKRDQYNASTGFSFDLTELDSLQMNLNWSKMNYVKRIAQYSDYDMLYTDLTWQRTIFDGKAALIFQAYLQHIAFDNPAQVSHDIFWGTSRLKQDYTQDVYSGMLGVYWMPLQQLTLRGMVGINRTETEIEIEQSITGSAIPGLDSSSTSKLEYGENGFTGSLDSTWRGERSQTRLIVKQEFIPSTSGELREATRISIDNYYSITKNFNFSAHLAYVNSKRKQGQSGTIKEDIWYGSLTPIYNLTENLSAQLQYMHYHEKNKYSDTTRKNNSVFLQFTYKKPMRF